MRKYFFVGLLFFCCPLWAADDLTHVSLRLAWKHQFQFAGFYMAKEKGYYKDEGIDVTFLEHSHNDTYQDVVSGKTDFAVLGPSVVKRYLNGLPIVALGVIFQQTPHVWLSLASKKINNGEDLVGKRFSITKGYEDTELTLLLWRLGLSEKDVLAQDITYGVEALQNNEVDLINAYVSNEPFQLTERNIAYATMSPLDYGLDFYGDVLFTSKALAERNPALVDRFRRASFKGWEYAFNHMDEAVDLILEKYNGSLHKSRDALLYEARQLLRLSYYPIVEVGSMNLERWKRNASLFNSDRPVSDDDLRPFLFKGVSPLRDFGVLLLAVVAAAVLLGLWGIHNRLIARVARALAHTDELTRLGNRMAFNDKMREVVAQHQRYKTPTSILLLDIDHFKMVNDTYGHQEGDRVLAALSHAMRLASRKTDFLYRFGGEEFTLLLPNVTLAQATIFAEKIRAVIQKNVHVMGGGVITVSIGVAELTVSDDVDTLLRRVDENLYRAKESGRNRVVAR